MPKHFRYIDALRGWAFLGVLLVHTLLKTRCLPPLLDELAAQGAYGVELFFIISAFTLFNSLSSRKKSDREPYLDFFIRRFFRIVPMFWAALLFSLFIDGLAPRHDAPAGFSGMNVLLEFVLLGGFEPFTIGGLFLGAWTIPTEVLFYCLIPLLYSRITTLQQALKLTFYSFLIACPLSLCVHSWLLPHYRPEHSFLVDHFVSYCFLSQLPVFSLGIVLYFILSPDRSPFAFEKTNSFSICLLAVAFALFFIGFLCRDFLYFNFFTMALGFVFLAWSLALKPLFLFVNQFTCFLGRISFSCYLTHEWNLRLLYRVAHHFKFQEMVIAHPYFYFGLWFALALLTTIITSSITYRLIEIPGINLGKRLIEKLNKPLISFYEEIRSEGKREQPSRLKF